MLKTQNKTEFNEEKEINSSFSWDSLASRNRFRDAIYSDENAKLSMDLWPPCTRDYKLQIVILSKDGWSKCEKMIDLFLSNMPDEFYLTLICGNIDRVRCPTHPRFALHVVSGKNIPELRTHIPNFLIESEWVSCLEDHAAPAETWIEETQAALENIPLNIFAFTGTFTNLHSIGNWSWASFIFNALNHWHPCASTYLPGSVGTTFFRRDLLGSKQVPFYHIEHNIFGREMPVLDRIQVNHTQHLSLTSAIYHNYCNGVASGAAMRLISLEPMRDICRHVIKILRERVLNLQKILEGHAFYSDLPKRTWLRVVVISISHCFGYITGAFFGPIGSFNQIE